MRSIIGLFVLIALCACNRPEGPEGRGTLEYFLQQQKWGVLVNGAVIFRYDEYESQIACNSKRKMLRFQTNNQEVYVQLIFSALPEEVGANVPLDVVVNYAEADGVPKSLKVIPVVVKRERGLCWCWDEEQKVGMVVPGDWDDLRK